MKHHCVLTHKQLDIWSVQHIREAWLTLNEANSFSAYAVSLTCIWKPNVSVMLEWVFNVVK